MCPLGVALLAATVAALALPAGSGARGWLPAKSFSPSDGVSYDQHASMSAAGESLVSWSQLNLKTALRSPGEADFGDPQVFTTNNVDTSSDIGPNGHAAAMSFNAGVAVFTARGPGGVFGTEGELPDQTNSAVTTQGTSAVGVDGAGNATFVYIDQASPHRVRAVVRHADGTFEPTQTVHQVSDAATDVHIAVDAAGNGFIVVDDNGLVRVHRRTGATGSWDSYTSLSSAHQPRVAVGTRPEVIVLYQNTSFEVRSFIISPEETLTTPVIANAVSGEANVSMDDAGNAIAVWQTCGPSCNTRNAFARRIGSHGELSDIQALSPSGASCNPGCGPDTWPDVTMNGAGQAFAVWRWTPSTGTSYVQGAWAAPGETFGASATIEGATQAAGPPSAAIDGVGDGLVAWQEGSAVTGAAIYDAAAPAFASVDVPATAPPRASVAFSASVSEAWGPVSIHWNFGDGTGADGASVSHSYATDGARTVTVTAADAAGNNSSATRTIDIVTPGGGGPPVLSGLALRPARFKAAPSGPSVTAAAKPGTMVSYSDSRAATTTFTVQRPRPGVRKGHRCVKPTRTPVPRRRRCTRYVAVGAFRHADAEGANHFRFTGRVRSRKLRPGRYRLRAVPAANGAKGKATTRTFRVRR